MFRQQKNCPPMVKLVLLLALVIAVANAFNAPLFEVSEQMRNTNIDYHGFVDSLAWSNAFQWANCTTGTVNAAVIGNMFAQLSAKLTSITTSTFRQCDRLTSSCYQCQNGAYNVSFDTVNTLVASKLEGQDNNMMDSVTEKIDFGTYTLLYNTNTPVTTANLACRATPSCFPCSYVDTINGVLQGQRRLTFKFTTDGLLIHRINTGARYVYYTQNEAGIKVFTPNNGAQLVPDSIMENFSLVGFFCA